MLKPKSVLSEALRSQIKVERISFFIGETKIECVVRPMSDYVLREWILAEQREFVKQKNILDQNPANTETYTDSEWLEITSQAKKYLDNKGEDLDSKFFSIYKEKPESKSAWLAREYAMTESMRNYVHTMLFNEDGSPMITEKEEIQLFRQALDLDHELRDKLTNLAVHFVNLKSEISKKKLKTGNEMN